MASSAAPTTDPMIANKKYVDDGADNMHDSEGGYNNVDVDGVKTKVYTKYLTGTTAAGATTTKEHDITGIDKILSVTSQIYSTTNSIYRVYSAGDVTGTGASYLLSYDGTNVEFSTVGANLQSQKYRIKIDYIL
jgi:hypothetical protein